jgi:hypothetical protein
MIFFSKSRPLQSGYIGIEIRTSKVIFEFCHQMKVLSLNDDIELPFERNEKDFLAAGFLTALTKMIIFL